MMKSTKCNFKIEMRQMKIANFSIGLSEVVDFHHIPNEMIQLYQFVSSIYFKIAKINLPSNKTCRESYFQSFKIIS